MQAHRRMALTLLQRTTSARLTRHAGRVEESRSGGHALATTSRTSHRSTVTPGDGLLPTATIAAIACAFSSPSNTTTESPLPATGASQVPDWNPGACFTPGTTVSHRFSRPY